MNSHRSPSYVALSEGGWSGSAAAVHETRPTDPPKPRLLDRVRAALRIRHYSRRTEKAYVAWILRYILFHGKRHPVEMGAPELTRFLSSLAVDRKVAASTQNQALSALLFLYRAVLELDLPWLDDVVRAKRPQRLPIVLTRAEAYPKGTTEFSGILGRVKAANPDVLTAVTYFEDAVVITRQLKEVNVNPKMFGGTPAGPAIPKYYELLGRSAEFVYSGATWEPDLVTLRAGGLIPIARQYPGAREFVESYRKEFPGADLQYDSARGYGECQILLEGIRRSGSLDSERIRVVILKMDLNTVFGPFKVDRDGFQIAHKTLMIQWQDGKKVIVWPEELAPGQTRFPTPPWSQRP